MVKKEITFMGEKVSVVEDKSGKILYAEYTEGSNEKVTFHCGRALINYGNDGNSRDLNGFSLNPVARELHENCGVDLSIGNKFVVSRTTSDEYGNKSVMAIAFEDVSKLEAAIKQMTNNNSLGYDGEHLDYTFLNPNQSENMALEPISLISYSKEKRGPGAFITEPSSVKILNGEQVDWNAIDIGCKNFLLQLIDKETGYVEGLNKIMAAPDHMEVIGVEAMQEEYAKNINPNRMRSPETAAAYKILSHNMEQMKAKSIQQK